MIPVEHARYLARSMANARLIELDGDDHLFYIGDQRELLGEIELLVTGTHRPAPSRVLSTVVFTDIVESTAEAQRQGDSEWRVTLDRHDAICAGEVARFGGRVIKTTGDGLLATFDRPTSAIECTTAIARSTRHLGLQLRAGIHTGEVEQRDGDITGIAVVIARRLCDLADADTTCVSRTVTDLVIGSDLTFVLIGERELKGIAGTWAIYQLSIDTQAGSAASS